MRLVGAVLAAVLCAGLLPGCSEEPEAKPVKEAPRLSRERYVDRANELCRRGAERIDVVERRIEGRRRAGVLAAIRNRVVPIQRKLATDLRALNGPPRLRREVEAVLEEVDRVLDYVAEDPARYDDLLFVGVNKEFTRLGIDDCGR